MKNETEKKYMSALSHHTDGHLLDEISGIYTFSYSTMVQNSKNIFS